MTPEQDKDADPVTDRINEMLQDDDPDGPGADTVRELKIHAQAQAAAIGRVRALEGELAKARADAMEHAAGTRALMDLLRKQVAASAESARPARTSASKSKRRRHVRAVK